MSNTVRLFADCNAFRAVEHFASFIRAFDLRERKLKNKKKTKKIEIYSYYRFYFYFTFRFFAFDITNSVFGFGATSMAFGRFADWIANCWAIKFY